MQQAQCHINNDSCSNISTKKLLREERESNPDWERCGPRLVLKRMGEMMTDEDGVRRLVWVKKAA